MNGCGVYLGESLAQYHFGEQHPFGPARHNAFEAAFRESNLESKVMLMEPVQCEIETLEYFHTKSYIDKVIDLSTKGKGFLDQGDTPAHQGIYEAACTVVGTTTDATERIMQGDFNCAFIPIAGLHHARRNSASGFCVFNDIGVAIEILKSKHKLETIAYIDIDAHHGDGVYYEFESDPSVIFADTHQDGRTLYPGTGDTTEIGLGEAASLKLNCPLPPYSDDEQFFQAWDLVESFIANLQPQFIILQAGADSLAGDPITQLQFSEHAHAHAARRLKLLADKHCDGKLLALGGGGYNLNNIAKAWLATLRGML